MLGKKITVKRLYPGMYIVSSGRRQIRVSRNNEAHPTARWFVFDDSRFSEGLIDAEPTYALAKQCAIRELIE